MKNSISYEIFKKYENIMPTKDIKPFNWSKHFVQANINSLLSSLDVAKEIYGGIPKPLYDYVIDTLNIALYCGIYSSPSSVKSLQNYTKFLHENDILNQE